MKGTLVRYKAKPESIPEHERLIAGVFRELRATAPGGVRYIVLRLEGDSYVHFSCIDDGAPPVPSFGAFRTFVSDVESRCIEQPQSSDALIVGQHGMLE